MKRRGDAKVTVVAFLFGFVGLGVWAALYYGELFLIKTISNIPAGLAWQISWPALAIGIIGIAGGFISLFSDITGGSDSDGV